MINILKYLVVVKVIYGVNAVKITHKDIIGLNPSIKPASFTNSLSWENDWDIVNLGNTFNIVAKHKNVSVLHLECTAPYEIVWNVEKKEVPFSDLSSGTRIESRQCGTFPETVDEMTIYSRTLSLYFKFGLEPLIFERMCEHIRHPINTTVTIFLPGHNVLLQSGQNLTYGEDNNLIPCPTSNPTIPVSLYTEDSKTGIQTKILKAVYDPSKGFYLAQQPTQVYICSAGGHDTVRFVPTQHLLKIILAKSLYPRPQVEVKDSASNVSWKNAWEITEGFDSNETNLIGKQNNETILRLDLECTAAEPIVWYLKHEFDKTTHQVADCDYSYELKNGVKVYSRSLSVRFNATNGLVTTFTCEHLSDAQPSIINIFIPNTGKSLVHSGTTITYYRHDTLIECPTTNPNIPITLWSENPATGRLEEVTDTVYNPTMGFKVKNISGVYICSGGKDDKVRFVPPPNRPVMPGRQEIPKLRFAQEPLGDLTLVIKRKEIILFCEETDYNTIMVVHNGNTILHERAHLTKNSAVDLNVNCGKKDSLFVYVFCVKADIQEYETKRGKVSSKLSVRPVIRKLTYPVNTSNESYYFTVNVTTPHGRIEWRRFPVDEEVFIFSNGGSTMYANYTSNFTCKALIKVSNVTFWMELVDGTRQVLKNDDSKFVKIEVEKYDLLAKFRTWKLSLRLPLNAVGILCVVPYNGHEYLYLSAARPFRTTYLQRPKITNTNSETTFTIGLRNQNLVCQCSAEPQAEFTWIKYDNNGKGILSYGLSSTVDQYRNGVLEFPLITMSHNGTYICTATNELGSDSYAFSVIVPGKTSGTADNIMLITSICIFVTAFFLFAFSIHRHYRTRIMIANYRNSPAQ